MWTVIVYKNALDGQNTVRVYDDSTERSFEDYSNAMDYYSYLAAKYIGFGVDIYEKYVYDVGELDLDELKKQDALNKLTEEEKVLLGLNP